MNHECICTSCATMFSSPTFRMSCSRACAEVENVRELPDWKPNMTAEEERLLLRKYTPMIYSEAQRSYRISSGHITLLDLHDFFQEAAIGFMHAVRMYDPDNKTGAKFITYALTCVRTYLMQRVQESNHIHTPGTEYWLARKPEGGRSDTRFTKYARAAQEVLHMGEIGRTRRDDGELYELEAPASRESYSDDFVPLYANLDRLKRRDKEVVERMFGLNGYARHTLEMTGEILGITKERVRQIRKRGLKELRGGLDAYAHRIRSARCEHARA